jgi:hypothetical protein
MTNKIVGLTKTAQNPKSKSIKSEQSKSKPEQLKSSNNPKTAPKKGPCTCNKCIAERQHAHTPEVSEESKQSKQSKQSTQSKKSDSSCATKCADSIDVQVDVIPEVILKKIENQMRTSFDVELTYQAIPKCTVIKKEIVDSPCGKCITKYILLVDSDVKLVCPPKITQEGKPFAKYEMEIIVDTDQKILSCNEKK